MTGGNNVGQNANEEWITTIIIIILKILFTGAGKIITTFSCYIPR